MESNDRIHAAALELLREQYHSISIVLARTDRPTLSDEIYYAESSTLERAVQVLWQDLCKLMGNEKEAYLTFSDWWVLDAETHLLQDKIGTLESLLDIHCPDVKRSLRAAERIERNSKKGLAIGRAMFWFGPVASVLAVIIAWSFGLSPLISLLLAIISSLTVICICLFVAEMEWRRSR
jgi:hypothetical protein